MAVIMRKDGRWAHYRRNPNAPPQWIWEYFGRGPEAEARARSRDREFSLEREARKIQPGLTVAALLQEYHERHLVEATTRDSDFYRIDRTLIPLLGAEYCDTLTTDALDRYVVARITAGRAHATVHRELTILRSAFSWATSRRPPLVSRNPLQGYRIQKSKSARVVATGSPVTSDEFSRLIEAAPGHLIRAMLLQWYLGTRPGRETLGITWGDVDFEHGEIRIRSAHKGSLPERLVPVHPGLVAELQKWLAGDQQLSGYSGGLLIVHVAGKAVASIKTAWKHTKERAGITRRLRLYDFRHAWFSNALRAGGDLKSISEIGGHSSPATTLTFYQSTVREQHREAVLGIPEAPKKN